MRILYIVPYTPSLIRVRPYQMIRTLARRGHEVTVGTLWSSEEDRSRLSELSDHVFQVTACRLSVWRSLWSCLRALPARTPLQAAFSWHPDLAEAIRGALRKNSYDVIHVEHLRGARFGLLAKQWSDGNRSNGKATPVIWDSVDCISHLFGQARSRSLSRKGRWMTGFEFARTRAYEAWLLQQFHRVLVTSGNDRRALLRTHGAVSSYSPADSGPHGDHVVIVPNGVDLEYFRPGGSPRDEATLVFTGKMSYHANVTAALHLVREIMPRVWARRPDVRLQIVGKDPPREIRDLPASARNGVNVDRVVVTGTVPDIRPFLWNATLSVVPLVYGAGIQNKVLEAMACGTPVITSAQAVSALEAQPGVDVVVAKGPEDFALAILELLQRPLLQQSLSVAGRRYVERHHDWNGIAARLESVYRGAVESLNEKLPAQRVKRPA